MNSIHYTQTEIVSQHTIARDTWQVRIRAPEMAQTVRPGQFFMVRLAQCNDPLIGRALALYDLHRDSHGAPSDISLVYLTKGKFTQALSRCKPGAVLDVWGPLGNAFSVEPCKHLVMVAGGVGITPMLSLAGAALGSEVFGDAGSTGAFASKVSLCYGARTAAYFAGLDAFTSRGVEVHLATEDGSLGHRGRVTEVLNHLLDTSCEGVRIACCGPEPMMEGVCEIAHQRGVPCEVSLETPMACGIGICFTCVAKIRQADGSWDYRRTCMEGPVFSSQQVVW
ncbi:MAG: dihydroorotate dehydrogenase electron transfer subunit [Pirellula sp.]|jgi:dihydroorotate dehydrogenase electron transfer subunit|nr:dihydroorotate dehydrogenase electron transfer subunit [Pirellula sp.]